MMKVCIVFFLALCSCPACATVQDDAKNRPVSKVITLLKDMVAQLEKEAEEDEEVYETMGCWCETNDKSKTKAIADAETKITKLNAEIEKQAGTSSKLNTEIQELEKELAQNQESLDTAAALREKQLAEFTEEEKDMLASIGSLGSAVTVLGKHHGASLLQSSASEVNALSVMAMVRDQLRRHRDMLAEVITP